MQDIPLKLVDANTNVVVLDSMQDLFTENWVLAVEAGKTDGLLLKLLEEMREAHRAYEMSPLQC